MMRCGALAILCFWPWDVHAQLLQDIVGASIQASPVQVTYPLSATSVGIVAGGVDNAPLIPALMKALGPVGGGGQTVVFPGTPSQGYTAYYFSQALVLSRAGEYKCSGVAGSNAGGTELVFAPGVDGVIQEDGSVSPDGGYGEGIVEGCTIVSMGFGGGYTTPGASTITGMIMYQDPGGLIPPTTWNVGDGVIVTPGGAGFETNGAATIPAVTPGAYVGGVSGNTLTLAAPYTINPALNSAPQGVITLRLPSALKFTVQTTIGSNSVLVTGGPRLLVPGDVVWCDAFPFGTTVLTASGSLGAQTVVMTVPFLNTTAQNATLTHAAGAPGQLWVMPAGLKRDTSAKSSQNFITQWPIGLEMACSAASPFNCTASHDSYNLYQFDLIGRWTAGDNTGASDSIGEEGIKNYIADLMEGGTLGETYINFNSNSAEAGTSVYSLIGNCVNDNFSTLVGGYLGYAGPECAAPVGLVPATAGDGRFRWGRLRAFRPGRRSSMRETPGPISQARGLSPMACLANRVPSTRELLRS